MKGSRSAACRAPGLQLINASVAISSTSRLLRATQDYLFGSVLTWSRSARARLDAVGSDASGGWWPCRRATPRSRKLSHPHRSLRGLQRCQRQPDLRLLAGRRQGSPRGRVTHRGSTATSSTRRPGSRDAVDRTRQSAMVYASSRSTTASAAPARPQFPGRRRERPNDGAGLRRRYVKDDPSRATIRVAAVVALVTTTGSTTALCSSAPNLYSRARTPSNRPIGCTDRRPAGRDRPRGPLRAGLVGLVGDWESGQLRGREHRLRWLSLDQRGVEDPRRGSRRTCSPALGQRSCSARACWCATFRCRRSASPGLRRDESRSECDLIRPAVRRLRDRGARDAFYRADNRMRPSSTR